MSDIDLPFGEVDGDTDIADDEGVYLEAELRDGVHLWYNDQDHHDQYHLIDNPPEFVVKVFVADTISKEIRRDRAEYLLEEEAGNTWDYVE